MCVVSGKTTAMPAGCISSGLTTTQGRVFCVSRPLAGSKCEFTSDPSIVLQENSNQDTTPRFHLHFTLTASSWLNMVEPFFAIVRDGICNRIFATLEELQVALTAVLQRYWQDARAVFSLIGKAGCCAANASGSDIIPA